LKTESKNNRRSIYSIELFSSGRTECQAATLSNLTRRSVNFERKASQRFSRRASYAIRKKIQEQEILREQEDERLKKLKCEQEAKLDDTKRSPELVARIGTIHLFYLSIVFVKEKSRIDNNDD
jgi:hypothetical protein